MQKNCNRFVLWGIEIGCIQPISLFNLTDWKGVSSAAFQRYLLQGWSGHALPEKDRSGDEERAEATFLPEMDDPCMFFLVIHPLHED